MLLFKAIVPRYLLMGRQAQEKPTAWQENNNYSQEMYTRVMRDKESYQELFSNYGKR